MKIHDWVLTGLHSHQLAHSLSILGHNTAGNQHTYNNSERVKGCHSHTGAAQILPPLVLIEKKVEKRKIKFHPRNASGTELIQTHKYTVGSCKTTILFRWSGSEMYNLFHTVQNTTDKSTSALKLFQTLAPTVPQRISQYKSKRLCLCVV